jgi:hypothetical protein
MNTRENIEYLHKLATHNFENESKSKQFLIEYLYCENRFGNFCYTHYQDLTSGYEKPLVLFSTFNNSIKFKLLNLIL